MKLTIWAELARGGIADYAHDQAEALMDRGVEVEVLCPPAFLEGRSFRYDAKPLLDDLRPVGAGGSRIARASRLVKGLLGNARTVAREVGNNRSDALLTHFSEYLAPFWAWRMRDLRKKGVRTYTVLHDPVRNHIVGPRWWHEFSVREAYSFIDTAFVHTYEQVPVPATVKVVPIPYGVHQYPQPSHTRAEVRQQLNIPEHATLLTSFGYIRDNKNLDLVLRAMASLKDVYLLVVGSEQAGGNRPVSFYQTLAEELGCADRCRWLIRFTSPEETADFMSASDLSLLVYARTFVSSSAALGVGANYRLPCLISSGSETTRAMVEQYRLGIWVEPDSADAICKGLELWLRNGVAPDWAGYMRDQSWDRNAALLVEQLSPRGC